MAKSVDLFGRRPQGRIMPVAAARTGHDPIPKSVEEKRERERSSALAEAEAARKKTGSGPAQALDQLGL